MKKLLFTIAFVATICMSNFVHASDLVDIDTIKFRNGFLIVQKMELDIFSGDIPVFSMGSASNTNIIRIYKLGSKETMEIMTGSLIIYSKEIGFFSKTPVPQQPAIPDATLVNQKATINSVLKTLRAYGLVAPNK